MRTIVLSMILLVPGAAGADLETVRAERNPEKRSDKALANASKILDSIREVYGKGDWKATMEALREVRDSVNLSYESLGASGKKASRNPKYFKRAELATRELIRRLDSLAQDMAVDERDAVGEVKTHVQEIHDKLLSAILERK